MSRRFAILGLSLLSGCGNWNRIALPADTTLAPRQQVQVYRGRQTNVLHAVRVTGDSVIGVPYPKPPSCDSCRVAIARSSVDSVRVGNMETAGILGSAIPFVLLAMLAIAFAGYGGPGS
jgi:hypothetical protein